MLQYIFFSGLVNAQNKHYGFVLVRLQSHVLILTEAIFAVRCHGWCISEGARVCVRAWTGRWGLLSMKGANDLEREMKREAWWRQGLACFVPRVRQHGQGISAAAASSLHFLHSACLISARTHTHTHAHAHIDEAIPQRHNEHDLA